MINKKYFVTGKEKYLLHKIKEMYNMEVALRARRGQFTHNFHWQDFLQEMIDYYKYILESAYNATPVYEQSTQTNSI